MVQQGGLPMASLSDIFRDVCFLSTYYHRKLSILFAQATKFPDPDRVDPTRSKATYSICGIDFYNFLEDDFAIDAITEMVRIILGQKNVRRAAGDAGRLVGFKKTTKETEHFVYLQTDGNLSPWPTRMHVVVSANYSSKLYPKY
jgi:hypothetical protein